MVKTDYLENGGFDVTIPLTDGTDLVLHNPKRECEHRYRNCFPLENGCYVMENSGKRGNIDPNVIGAAVFMRYNEKFLKQPKKYSSLLQIILRDTFPEKAAELQYQSQERFTDKGIERGRWSWEYISEIIKKVKSGKNFNISKESARAFREMFSA